MDAIFFYYSIYDRFIQGQPCACVHACMCAFVNFIFKKTSPQKLLTGLLPNLIEVFLSSSLQKNQAYLWSDTGAQAPLVVIVSDKLLF